MRFAFQKLNRNYELIQLNVAIIIIIVVITSLISIIIIITLYLLRKSLFC